MNTFFVVAVIAIFNFLLGAATSYTFFLTRGFKSKDVNEKDIYCHGFEDGIYYTIDEYKPELYRPEIAERCYKEYKAIKHGPENH